MMMMINLKRIINKNNIIILFTKKFDISSTEVMFMKWRKVKGDDVYFIKL